jgi:hypothetical protein
LLQHVVQLVCLGRSETVKRSALRTYIGLGLELGFGLLPLVLFSWSWWSYIPNGPALTEELVLCASVGIANFALTAVALSLFWAVRDMRLNRIWAVLLFPAAAAVSVFVPTLLIHASRLFWPHIFTGDSGFGLGILPYCMACVYAGAVVVFAISLVFARWRSHPAPSEPAAGSRSGPDGFLRGSLFGSMAVIVCALLVWVVLSIRNSNKTYWLETAV